MTDFKRPANPQEFEENFEQLHPIMNATQAHYESSRCLFCHDAPCIAACPTGIDIPLFIRQINTNNLSGAAKTIYESNWLGNICGKVCPTEVLCEGACVYNHQEVKPIEIGRLQSYASSAAVNHHKQLFVKAPDNGKRVAVVGAGPAGISAACELALLGCTVTVYEAKEQPSGLALYGVAPYKILNNTILEEVEYLQKQFGFQIEYQHPLQTTEDFERLDQAFDAVFLGIGLGSTRELRLEGESLDGCRGAVEFIEMVKTLQHQAMVGKKVVVLGGGNTAMDAASEACRLGAEQVVLAYRRSMDEMRAYEFEYKLAKSVGAVGLWNATPLAIVGKEKVAGVRFIKTKTVDNKLETIPGSDYTIDCDMVIKATGQNKQKALVQLIPDIQTDPSGRILTVNDLGQTHNARYFTGGDAMNGGKEVVNAVAEAKVAARGIHQYLTENQG